ncbi:hypothetical protein SLEP1_g30855 [Rubroshorea leprosula]|uniref:Uncharacterized protein n=1 Tax=Rubroshorea leprosula TaxID=152421 RepID=A0AAV5K6W2_9ROSI|nr:hypothetical protein SLEP1_g30855 [Rubroshorea leprosula]
MAPKICMNSSCRTASTPEWKKGWPLRSGGYADLCYTCGFGFRFFVCSGVLILSELYNLQDFLGRTCGIYSTNYLTEVVFLFYLLKEERRGSLCAQPAFVPTHHLILMGRVVGEMDLSLHHFLDVSNPHFIFSIKYPI